MLRVKNEIHSHVWLVSKETILVYSLDIIFLSLLLVSSRPFPPSLFFFQTKLLLSIPTPHRTVCSFTRESDSILLSLLNLSYPSPRRVVHGYLLAYIYLNRVTSTRTMGGLSLNKLLNRTLSILCPWFLLRWRVSFHFTARYCLETRRHSVLKSHARTCSRR